MATDPASLLREHGLHVTAQRLAVLRAVSSHPHCTAEEVAEHARAEIGTISRQAVYDALGILADNGLIRRIEPAGVAGALRVPRRRQPPSPDLPHLRKNGGRRLRRSASTLPYAGRHRGLPDRRGGGDLLGQVSRMSRGVSGLGRRLTARQPRHFRFRPTSRPTHTGEILMSEQDDNEVPVHRRSSRNTPPAAARPTATGGRTS